MKLRYHVFRRENGIYYSLNNLTKKRESLNTTRPEEAQRLLNALNEACNQPAVNLQIARVYLQHSDPDYAKRTWRFVMDRMPDSDCVDMAWRYAAETQAGKFCRLRARHYHHHATAR